MKFLLIKTLIFSILCFPLFMVAQPPSPAPPTFASSFLTDNHQALPAFSGHVRDTKETQCLRTGQWIGLLAGAGIGVLHTYWSIKYTPDKHIPVWKHLTATIPATLIGSYVGSRIMRWATARIMDGKPKPAFAVLKGAFFGAIAGSAILAANYIPLFVFSHYLGTIRFNNLGRKNQLLKLIGISILGSVAYGGTFGAIAGAIYGPCIALYLHF